MKETKKDGLADEDKRLDFIKFLVNNEKDEEFKKLSEEERIAIYTKQKAGQKEQIGTMAVIKQEGKPEGKTVNVVYRSNGQMPKDIAAHYDERINPVVREGLNEIFDRVHAAEKAGKPLSPENERRLHSAKIGSKLIRKPEQKAVRYDER